MSVIQLSGYKRKTEKFRFVKESVRIEKENPKTKEIQVTNHILIMLKNTENGVALPHPLSEFLNKWKNRSFSTIERRATEIIPFLNYILIDRAKEFEIESLWDIMFEHGEEFLNEVALDKKKNTVKQYESTLTEFYYFLAKKNLLKHIELNDFHFVQKRKDGKDVQEISSPFENVEYPYDTNQKNILHHLPKELIIPFIDTAIRFTPRIALGVYFQFFGGLRIGEVVNLTRESMTTKGSYGENGIVLDVKKRDLRPDLLDNRGKGEVKKPRFQVVIPIHRLTAELVKNHLKNYGFDSKTGALFTNKDGFALTEENYRYYFGVLKEAFLKRLKESGDLTLQGYALSLSTKKWNSHIGRGVFSNMIADAADNIMQIALSRGDSSLDASLAYLSDSSKIGKKVEENLQSMYRKLLE